LNFLATFGRQVPVVRLARQTRTGRASGQLEKQVTRIRFARIRYPRVLARVTWSEMVIAKETKRRLTISRASASATRSPSTVCGGRPEPVQGRPGRSHRHSHSSAIVPDRRGRWGDEDAYAPLVQTLAMRQRLLCGRNRGLVLRVRFLLGSDGEEACIQASPTTAREEGKRMRDRTRAYPERLRRRPLRFLREGQRYPHRARAKPRARIA
jgi:hypothetical protein